MYLKQHTLIIFFLVLMFQGYSLAPDYLPPRMPVAENFPAGEDQTAADGQYFPQSDWSDYFIDPALQKLITTALADNRDSFIIHQVDKNRFSLKPIKRL